MSINSTVTLTQMSEKMAQLILHEYSILSFVLFTVYTLEVLRKGEINLRGGKSCPLNIFLGVLIII